MISGRHRDAWPALGLMLPGCVLLALFVGWPLARTLLSSVRSVDLLSPESGRWLGLQQYGDLFADPRFLRALYNSAVFCALVVPAQTSLALLLALWVNRRERAYRHLRFVFLAPTLVAMPVLAVIWCGLYQPAMGSEMGLINAVLVTLGIAPHAWLSEPAIALPAIALMSIWQGVGLQTLVFLGGLQTLPREMFEAAELDGAGPWQRVRYLTVPMLRNSIVFVVTVTTILACRLFVQPYLMTHGGPDDRTLSIVQWIYESTFVDHDLGRASAAGLVLLSIVTCIALVQRRLLPEEVA